MSEAERGAETRLSAGARTIGSIIAEAHSLVRAQERLKEAAPDMLEALRLAKKRIEFYGAISSRQHFDHDLKEIHPVIDAALSRATGQDAKDNERG